MIPLLKDVSAPLSRQVYMSLRQAILNGTFRAGERLPSTRALAESLSISRTVVVVAYEQLLAEGFVTGRAGSGTFVSKQLTHRGTSKQITPASLRLSRFGNSANDAARRIRKSGPKPRPRYDFAYGRSNIDIFPFETWRRIVIGRLRKAPIKELDYGASAGSSSLRKALAAHLRRARGLACDESQIVIVNGSQQALDITARVLLDVGEPVVLENPHYLGTREIVGAAGATLVPVPVDREGLVVSELPRQARFAVVTPSHQFPTGAVLPLSRRLALLDWAKSTNAVIVEDDYDGEFRYEGQPLEPLKALDREERVIYIGTFSRTVFPSLRLGYLIAPSSLVRTFVGTKWLCDWHTSTLEQETLADFIRCGAYERHVRKASKTLAEKKQCLVSAIRSTFGNSVEVTGENAGTHIVIWPNHPFSEDEVLNRAASLGVGIYAISQNFIGRPPRLGFLLGYSRLTPREIREGVHRLGQIPLFRHGQ